MALTPKQAKFVREYPQDFNATQACIRAGYSAHSARFQGQQNLQHPEIAAAIAEQQREDFRRAGIDAAVAIRAVWDQAFTDPRELSEHHVDACRYCWGDNNRYQRTAEEMRKARAQYEHDLNAQIKKDPKADVEEFDLQGGIGWDPRKTPNEKCGECFGRGVPRVVLNDTRFLSKEALNLFAGVQKGKDGTKILVHSQTDARKLILQHLGLLVEKVEHSGKLDVSDLTPEQREAEIRDIIAAITRNSAESES